ncbi:MAG: hypothetical protein ACOCG6_01860 [Candidatus Cloacimonadaceae bacterium]
MLAFDDVAESRAQSGFDYVLPIGFRWRCGHDVVMGMSVSWAGGGLEPIGKGWLDCWNELFERKKEENEMKSDSKNMPTAIFD